MALRRGIQSATRICLMVRRCLICLCSLLGMGAALLCTSQANAAVRTCGSSTTTVFGAEPPTPLATFVLHHGTINRRFSCHDLRYFVVALQASGGDQENLYGGYPSQTETRAVTFPYEGGTANGDFTHLPTGRYNCQQSFSVMLQVYGDPSQLSNFPLVDTPYVDGYSQDGAVYAVLDQSPSGQLDGYTDMFEGDFWTCTESNGHHWRLSWNDTLSGQLLKYQNYTPPAPSDV